MVKFVRSQITKVDGDYDTNFGIDDYAGEKGFPELHFNLVVGRKFTNALVTNLTPLIIVASMLFFLFFTDPADIA